MRVRYQGPALEVEIRDLRGHRHGVWRAGEEQEIGPDEKTQFRQSDGTIVVRSLLDSLFSCGPDFVDAASGTNPLHTCNACKQPAMDEFFVDPGTLEPIYLREDPHDEASPKLCLTDFLALHPEYERLQIAAGVPVEIVTEARKRRKTPAPPEAIPMVPAAHFGGVEQELVPASHSDEEHE
jgi:hypothetical protein